MNPASFNSKKVLESGITYIDSDKIIKDVIKLYAFNSPHKKEKVVLRFDDGSPSFVFRSIEIVAYKVLLTLVKNFLIFHDEESNLPINVKKGKILGRKIIDLQKGLKIDAVKNYNFINFYISVKFNEDELADFQNKIASFGDYILSVGFIFGSKINESNQIIFSLYFPELDKEENEKARELLKLQQSNIEYARNIINQENKNLKKVLIADDEAINLKIISKFINSYVPQVKIDIVDDGLKALEIIKSLHAKNDHYDLIISDIQMPHMDGFELAKKIRDFDDTTPIAAYTSRTSYKIKQKALDCGIDEYVIKPIPNLRLLRIVFKWLIDNRFYNYDFEKVIKSLKGLRVLVADDEMINLIMIKKFLEKYGMIVDIVQDGAELVKKYKSQFLNTHLQEYDKNHNPHYQDPNLVNKYDVIIADIAMPVKCGNVAVKEIRDFELVYNIQNLAIIIAFSADNQTKKIKAMLKKGFDDYFAKGDDYNVLLKKIYFWILTLRDQKDLSYLNIYNKEQKIEDARSNSRLINDKLSDEELKEFGDLFIKSTKNLIDKIKRAKIDNNVEDLAFHSHALKGISGNIGAEKLFLYISIINNHARRDLWPQNSNWFEELKEIAELTIDRIQEY